MPEQIEKKEESILENQIIWTRNLLAAERPNVTISDEIELRKMLLMAKLADCLGSLARIPDELRLITDSIYDLAFNKQNEI